VISFSSATSKVLSRTVRLPSALDLIVEEQSPDEESEDRGSELGSEHAEQVCFGVGIVLVLFTLRLHAVHRFYNDTADTEADIETLDNNAPPHRSAKAPRPASTETPAHLRSSLMLSQRI
jgi:hypothetical protein